MAWDWTWGKSIKDTLKSIAIGFFVTDPDTGKTTFSAVAGLSNIMGMIRDSFLGWVQSLKDGFYDKEGNFSLTAGIKNLAGDVGTLMEQSRKKETIYLGCRMAHIRNGTKMGRK